MHVLIVDDEPEIRDIYKTMLEVDGHAAIAAVSGHEALEYLERHRPDVIVTDLLMPDGGGMRVVDAARRLEIPFVIVSGYAGAYTSVIPRNARIINKGGDELNQLGRLVREVGGHKKTA